VCVWPYVEGRAREWGPSLVPTPRAPPGVRGWGLGTRLVLVGAERAKGRFQTHKPLSLTLSDDKFELLI